MLDAKSRINIENYRIQACLNNGGTIEFPGDEDEEKRKGTPGIDFPVGENQMNF